MWMEVIKEMIRWFIIGVLGVLWCIYALGCGGLSVDVWDRKRSDVCEDWEEHKGSCRDGKGVLVHYRWIM